MNLVAFLLAQAGVPRDGGGGGPGLLFWIIYLAVIVLSIAGLWAIFAKAGKPGWAAIIPFYNGLVLLEIVGKPWWWILLYLVPCVNFIINIVVLVELAKVFGKGAGFAIGLIFLPFIFTLILGFGDARYVGPARASAY